MMQEVAPEKESLLRSASWEKTETMSSSGSDHPSLLPHHTTVAVVANTNTKSDEKLPIIKLLFGAGGIYASFLYYGSLQEDVFRYQVNGERFTYAWFLMAVEALANIVVGYIGLVYTGRTPNLPLQPFCISGITQVTSKACTSLALASGLSFPVATLAKSAKMAPVMAGSLLLGGARYSLRDYLQVAMIIAGTAMVSMGKSKKASGSSSVWGVVYILGSLAFDGVTAGFQKKLQSDMSKLNLKPKPYDFMFYTNAAMFATALVISAFLGDLFAGFYFCLRHPTIFSKIIQFSSCSAIGQSFIFYTLANFDPLILSTVTTTRKIFSVLLSIFFKGNSLSGLGWSGILVACSGIGSELQAKASKTKKSKG